MNKLNMKTIYYIGITILALWLGSCAQDDTVNSFKDLNEVTFNGLKEKYSVMLYDYLNIPLSLTTSQNDDSHLSYVWYLSTDTTRKVADTLSKSKDLNVLIDPSHAVPGENYTLTLKVTDETTGVYYRQEMKLEVMTQFTKGTVLLCEENGEAELNFLNSDHSLIENIYSRANGGKRVGRNPLRIFSVNPLPAQPSLKFEAIMCEDENGGMLASPVSFEGLKPLRKGFAVDFEETVLKPELYFKGMLIDYIIINRQVCRRAVNMLLPEWETPLVATQGVGNYEVAPFVMDATGAPIFYDTKNKRLLWHYMWNWGGLHQLSSPEADISQFDCDHIGEHMEMLCCGNQSEQGNYWMLMKDTSTGKLYIYKYKFVDQKFTSVLRKEIGAGIAPHLAEAIAFAANDDFPDVLMYATGSRIYSLSLNLFNSSSTEVLEAPQVDLTSRNMEITGFKFVTISQETEMAGETRQSAQLRICIRDNNQTGLKGGVSFYEESSQGGIHADYLFDKTGFCDTVVDIDEKYS